MSDMSKILNDDIFIIDSTNLGEIESKLLGVIISEKGIFRNEEFDKGDDSVKEYLSNQNVGIFLLLCKSDDKITIKRDSMGSFGIYYYENANYFAISNSFEHLAKYLKNKVNLTINRRYCNYIMNTQLCSEVLHDTTINEIQSLSRSEYLEIDLKTSKMNVLSDNNQLYSIPLDSKEALLLIDNWVLKWVNIIHNLQNVSNHIQVDLTGGMDTRMTLLLVLLSQLDLSKIYFHTDKAPKIEDFKISEMIAKKFDFELNKNHYTASNSVLSMDDALELSDFAKSPCSKQWNIKNTRHSETQFKLTGSCGEAVKLRPHLEPYDLYIFNELKRVPDLEKNQKKVIIEDISEILRKTFEILSNRYGIDIQDPFISQYLYVETRLSNHFGRGSLESYLCNSITVPPLADPDLWKIRAPSRLLTAVLFCRYVPELLYIPVQGGRDFTPDEIELAKTINSIIPPKSITFTKMPFYFKPIVEDSTAKQPFTKKDVNDHIEKIVDSFSKRDFGYLGLCLSYTTFDESKDIVHRENKFSQYIVMKSIDYADANIYSRHNESDKIVSDDLIYYWVYNESKNNGIWSAKKIEKYLQNNSK